MGTSYGGADGGPDTKERGKLQIKQNAHGLFRKRGTSTALALMSVHWPGKRMRREQFYGVRWSKRAANFLARRYPATSRPGGMRVIAGDFNRDSHRETSGGGRRAEPFWRTLTSPPYDYVDTVWTVDARPNNKDIVNGGFDYIFARARAVRAGADSSYDRVKALGHPRKFYADHRFRWALIAP